MNYRLNGKKNDKSVRIAQENVTGLQKEQRISREIKDNREMANAYLCRCF